MKIRRARSLNAFPIAALLLALSSAPGAQADTAYTYDALGRLKTVTYTDGTIVTYIHDATGNRTSKLVATPGSTFTQTIQVIGSGPVDLHALAVGQGYNDAQNANVTFQIGNGVIIKGDPGGGIGVDTGTWPTGFTIALSLVVKTGGAIYGGGGGGGRGGAGYADYGLTGGEDGGDAVYVQAPISITVQSGGAIKGGGDGGSGGSGGDYNDGSGGDYCWGGGGGGGGFPNGAGGAGGDTNESPYYGGCYVGNNGSDGTTSGGGAGGARLDDSPNYMGDGDAGGAAGGGYAIRKNGKTVPVSGPGTITGTVG